MDFCCSLFIRRIQDKLDCSTTFRTERTHHHLPLVFILLVYDNDDCRVWGYTSYKFQGIYFSYYSNGYLLLS
jgi:hypothetical protein